MSVSHDNENYWRKYIFPQNRNLTVPKYLIWKESQRYLTLSEYIEHDYFHTADYDKDLEGAVNAIDPMIKINWPQPITECSDRDRNNLMLTNNFKGISV